MTDEFAWQVDHEDIHRCRWRDFTAEVSPLRIESHFWVCMVHRGCEWGIIFHSMAARIRPETAAAGRKLAELVIRARASSVPTAEIDWDAVPIDQLPLRKPLREGLRSLGVTTVGGLLGRSWEDIYSLKNVGTMSYTDLGRWLAKRGLTLKGGVGA